MLASQTVCSRVEQSSVINFLLAEKGKPCEIHAKMCYMDGKVYVYIICYMFGKVYVGQRNLYRWAKHGFAAMNLS